MVSKAPADQLYLSSVSNSINKSNGNLRGKSGQCWVVVLHEGEFGLEPKKRDDVRRYVKQVL